MYKAADNRYDVMEYRRCGKSGIHLPLVSLGIWQNFGSASGKYEDQKKDKKITMEMHVVRLGDIAFATNRFELFMDFQHRIQARSPFEQTFIVQLVGQPYECSNGGGYLCTERAFEGRGYSAIVFSIQVSHEGGQELVNETVKQLKDMYEEK